MINIKGWIMGLTSEIKKKRAGPGAAILSTEGREKIVGLRYYMMTVLCNLIYYILFIFQ